MTLQECCAILTQMAFTCKIPRWDFRLLYPEQEDGSIRELLSFGIVSEPEITDTCSGCRLVLFTDQLETDWTSDTSSLTMTPAEYLENKICELLVSCHYGGWEEPAKRYGLELEPVGYCGECEMCKQKGEKDVETVK